MFAILFLQMVPLEGQKLRPFTVRDSIELVRFDDQSAEDHENVLFAPDGRSFIVVTKRGVLSANTTESTMWLFDTQEVSRFVNSPSDINSPVPRVVARMSSSSTGSPITHVRWSTDGHSIVFIGGNGNREPRLFIIEVNGKNFRQLSPNDQAVSAFDQAGGTYVFTAGPAVGDADLYQSAGSRLPDIQMGTGRSLLTLLFPKFEETVFGLADEQLWEVQNNKLSRIDNSRTSMPISLVRGSYLHSLALSPSGHYVVAVNNVERVPPEWESYEPAASYAKFEASDANAQPALSDLSPAQYVLIDLQKRQISPLVSAPLGLSAAYYLDAVRAKWSNDEKKVAVSNTFVPLRRTAENSGPTRPCVAVVDLATHVTKCVRETPAFVNGKPKKNISDIEWRNSDQDVLVRYGGQDGRPESELFHHDNGVWQRVANFDTTALDMRLSVAVQESVDAPPVLVASDLETKKSKKLWDPNPQLAAINLGKAEVYRWHDKDGHDWIGGLVLPPKYTPGQRYPLVIQTHGFNPDKFLSDGFYSTANAARALAARGIVVLQVAEPRWALFTPQDPEVDGRLGYESAIAQLAADGIIDAGKVGLIGFSHTGIYVLDSLIHSPSSFAAATLAECSTDSLWEYLINADYRGPQTVKVATDLIGSAPFGDGLKLWLSRSPGFSTDKIHVPVLFEENSPPTLVYSWDLYAALRLQARPVELLYMRSGKHILEQPSHLYASQEMNADWYDFWLNGHEDPNPTKSPQYSRWHQLRALQENRISHAQ